MKIQLSWLFVWAILCLVSMARADPIRVAVYQGDGAGRSSSDLLKVLNEGKEKSNLEVTRISPEEIQEGRLADFDVLIHPGGSGSKQGKALDTKGREAVRKFVETGGGYIGICAGAYLATDDYSWSLRLIEAKVVDRRHWARGTGSVEVKLSTTGRQFFGVDRDQVDIYYGQGPLLARREWDKPDVPDYESLGIYQTGIAKNGAPEGIMPGTSAMVRANYGKGRVFCFSPHPEKTDSLGFMVVKAVLWSANRER